VKRTDVDDVSAVSQCLQRYFSEQLGEVLVPEHPPDGVRLDKVGVRARITMTSSFLQKIRDQPFRSFVALSVTQIPSGEYIIDRLHPVANVKHSEVPACSCIYRRDGIGHQIFRNFRTWSSQQMSRPEYYWSVCVYDSSSKAVEVFNVQEHSLVCRAEISSKIASLIEESAGQCMKQIVASGTLEASFSAGLHVERVAPMQNTWRIQFINLPIQSTNEFRSWLSQFFGDKLLPKTAIQWANAFDASGDVSAGIGGTVILNSEAIAAGVIAKGGEFIRKKPTSGDDAGDVDVNAFLSNDKSHGSRILATCTTASVTALTLRDRLSQFGVKNVVKLFEKASNYTIYLRNLPVKCREPWLKEQLCGRPAEIKVKSGVVGASTHEAFIQFLNVEARNAVMNDLNATFSLGHFDTIVTFPSMHKAGKMVTKNSRPETLPKDTIGSATYVLSFGTAQQTDEFYQQYRAGGHCEGIAMTLDCKGEVLIKYPELFPNLRETVAKIGAQFSVRTSVKDKAQKPTNKNTGRVLKVDFSGAVPSLIEKAIAALKAVISSIALTAPSDKQKAFYNELSKSSSFKEKVAELRLRVDWAKGPRGEIFGPRMEQGELMRFIADKFTDFEARYLTFQLTAGINNLFYKGKVGAAKFIELQTAWKGRCALRYRLYTSDIVAHFSHGSPEADILQLHADIDFIIESIGGSSAKTTQTCVYCQKQLKTCSDFLICGHSYCVQCLSSACDNLTATLNCPLCHTVVHVKDIKNTLAGEQFAQRCSLALRAAVCRDKSKFSIRPCPSAMCMGMLPLTTELQLCGECSSSVCVACNTVNRGTHTGRSCQEVAELSERLKNVADQMKLVIADGEKFVRDNWSADLSPVTRVDINPGIFWDCQSHVRFNGCLERGSDLTSGFYAWHGTAEGAIGAICDTGFSPKFRSGQACGPGEYFGTHPNVSLGYARGSSRLILAYIVNSSLVKHVPNFCYVVKNPEDWSYSYCMPLLVASFGKDNSAPPFIMREHIQGPAATNKKEDNSSGGYGIFPSISGIISSIYNGGGSGVGESKDETTDLLDKEFGGLKISATESCAVSAVSYTAPYRWHWQHDDRSFKAYKDEINSLIETYFDAMRHRGGAHRVLTPPIVRYVDDVPQKYFIDFDKNQQINQGTNFPRQICRKEVDLPMSTAGRWYIMNDENVWSRFESLIEGEIELAFSNYRRGISGSKTTVTFPGRPEMYEIDFVEGTQRNTVTDTKRPVKRAS
jgi:hypothetical protein